MTERISLSELENYLWGSAVYLRTNIDAGAYKQYIFPLLFFKRICDVYDEECCEILKLYDGDEEALHFPENHRFQIPEGCHWKDVREVSENVGQALVDAFRGIERANSDKLQGIFGDAAWTNKRRLSDTLLKNLIEHFSSKTLSLENCPEDELGQGYEYLIKKFADDSGHTAQEFYTNRTVVHLMTELLRPQPRETIYDPTCGSAGMLISAIRYLQDNNLEWRNVGLFGQEFNALTASIARMNLFLHGVKDFSIIQDDTLKNPGFIDNGELKTFDVVLANPPYSINEWDREAFENDKYGRNFLGVPPQGRADYAFIQHIIKSLDNKSGRCAILLPHGVLARDEEYNIRKNLIKSDIIDCVIGIGSNLFYNSPMTACILICRKNKPIDKKGKILFIDASNEVTKTRSNSYLEEKHIQRISNAYNNYKCINNFSSVETIDNIEQQNYSLAIPYYVCSKEVDSSKIYDISLNSAITNWNLQTKNLQLNLIYLRDSLEEKKI